MARFLWRVTVITHRYLGVAVGILMLVWFASGIVMMYVPYPDLTPKEKLRALALIPWQSACCSLAEQNIPDDVPIFMAQIQALAGEPVMYLFPGGRPPRLSSLGPSGPLLEIDQAKADAVMTQAAPRIMGRAFKPVFSESVEVDQWTVGDAGAGNRPLFHYVFDDAARTQLYVSGTTGEVVLWTTGWQRFWNWFGAIPHWLYFTELRRTGPLWAQIVIWTSIVGGFLTVLGLYLGITQIKAGRGGRFSPYRGWFYWHHIAGLVFGVVTLTWVISGTFSMNPWGFLEGGGGDERMRVAGEPIAWSTVRASIDALKQNAPRDAVNLTSAPLDGKLFWLASTADGSVTRLDAQGIPAAVSEADLQGAVERLGRGKTIESQTMMTGEDAYYFDFSIAERSDSPPFPVYRVVLSDAEHTRLYLSPQTGQLLRKVDANGRGSRWLFSGLHRIDFFGWLRVRPIWDLVVLVLMLGGLGVTGTGVYLAVLRIKRDLTFKRAQKELVSPG
jgi:hypothetical protein